MSLYDFFGKLTNPAVRDTFNLLLNRYKKGLIEFCDEYRISYTNPSYDDLKNIHANKDYIISKHEHILFIEQSKSNCAELANLRKSYPHAFIVICQEVCGGIIYDSSIKMPGFSKIYPKPLNGPFGNFLYTGSFPKKYYNGCYDPIDYRSKDRMYNSEPKCVEDLRPFHVKDLLAHKYRFASLEQELLHQIKNEEIDVSFKKEIESNVKRYKYLSLYLAKVGHTINDKEFIISHLSDLDLFISGLIQSSYIKIKSLYPKGLSLYEKYKSRDKYIIINNESRITLLEEIADKFVAFSNLEDLQKDYEFFCESLNLPSLQKYVYNIPFEKIDIEGKIINGSYQVCQRCIECYYSNNDVDFIRYCPQLEDVAKKIPNFLNKSIHYYEWVYDKIFEFIELVKNKYGSVTVVWGESSISNYADINSYHFTYLQNKLNQACISNVYFDNLNLELVSNYLIIIELITSNSSLRYFCKKILSKHKSFKPLISYISLSKELDKDEVERIVNDKRKQIDLEEKRKSDLLKKLRERAKWIKDTYTKGFAYYHTFIDLDSCDIALIKSIIDSESQIASKNKLLCEQERIRLLNERKKLEEERIARDRSMLCDCVSSWHLTRYGFKHNYLFEYLKTSAPRQATEEEWYIRNLIWAFKDGPNTINNHCSYDNALRRIIPEYKQLLKNTFGNLVSKLTLVCVPASSPEKNRLRWAQFSDTICSDLSMTNAYQHISVIGDVIPKRLGGPGSPKLHIDSQWFRNRFIVICDDIKTTGKSIANLKAELEGYGATVICALTIGITIHE